MGLGRAASSLSQGAVGNGPLPEPFPLFPLTNWWNLDISSAPVDQDSGAFIAFINNGSLRHLHPDLGGEVSPGSVQIYGMPYGVVDETQPKKAVQFHYWRESDGVNLQTGQSFPFYPIPDEAITQAHWIEGGEPGNIDRRATADRHMIIVDRGNKLLYELYSVYYDGVSWQAGSGAFFDMKRNDRRPETWTSADAAGLAILPGLVRYDEVFGPGEIRHAFRVTLRDSNGYVYPASHSAGSNPQALPMGARLRLKAGRDISGFRPEIQKIFRAMKRYGLMMADNGADMFITGTFDTRWNNDILNPAFAALTASDFEVIQLGYDPPISRIPGDFDGDGRPDILFHNSGTGQNAVWKMNGTGFAGIVDLPALSNVDYRAEGVGDFNGDGVPDIVWRNPLTGHNAVWLMSGSSVLAVVDLPSLGGANYAIQATGDFNGDGKPDLLWRNAVTGQNAIWLMDGAKLLQVIDLPVLAGANWAITGTGDFNGDGMVDILLRNTATGQDAVWLMRGTSFLAVVDLPALVNGNYRFEAVADYNGDGKPDIVLRNSATGQNAIWLMNGTAVAGIADLPALADRNWDIGGPR